jgi:hypothetical protein
MIPEAVDRILLTTAKTEARAFYEERLRGLRGETPTMSAPLFALPEVSLELDGGVLQLMLKTPFESGDPVIRICYAMNTIADFAESLVRELAADGVRGYSAKVVYYRNPDWTVAWIASDGSIHCSRGF